MRWVIRQNENMNTLVLTHNTKIYTDEITNKNGIAKGEKSENYFIIQNKIPYFGILSSMRIVTFRRITEFSKVHPQSRNALEYWYHKTTLAEWNNLNDIRQTFGSADYAGNNRYVFNVKGNDFRLVAIVIFASKKVYIRFIGTHNEYNHIDCSSI
mgnify:CR=1 FL=1